ncbi:MAG: hypothetical protein M3Q31_11415 [Actinomycetota bacterium]|nr:hypothetical protein [Actinomycetota bacterium]
MAGGDEELRAELLAMRAADESVRQVAPALSQEAMGAALRADRARTARLAEIVTTHGWPGRSLVGEDGMYAAWILAQHSDHDAELQARFLELLEDAVELGEAPASVLAYLTDRVRVNGGRLQIYGTQFGGSGESYGPQPIADRDGLEERRADAGLEPFAEYEPRMRESEAEHRAGGDPR